MKPPPDPHYSHRFPAEIISHVVWLYHVFSSSLRVVELLLAERGVLVSYETVRRWCKKFAASFSDRIRPCRPRAGDKWHMDVIVAEVETLLEALKCGRRGLRVSEAVGRRRDEGGPDQARV